MHKTLICIVIIIVAVLVLAAKYDTRGVYPGTEAGKMFSVDVTQRLEKYGIDVPVEGHTHTWLYKNTFGRLVVVHGLIRTHTDSVWDQLCEKFGGVVWRAQTVPTETAVTTHLDFFNAYRDSWRFLIPLIEKAGEPEYLGMDQPHYCFKTWDGYIYVVQAMVGGGALLTNIIDPQGNYMEEQEINALTQRILVFYLVLAAILSCVLVCLLVIPKRIEKRKAKKLLKQEG